jgi:tRNA 2-thiocytidine biosynthesis protein TtcA
MARPLSAVSRTKKTLLRRISRLNREFNLIEHGDHVMVACSGGKDSWTLLHLLRAYRKILPFEFTMVAVHLDQGHPGFPVETVRAHFESHGFDHRIVTQDILSVVRDKLDEGTTACSLCSRLRRGVLYRVASEVGATKLALGHHWDDTIETLLLNLFFAGQIKAMPPRLLSDDGRHVVIRPLAYCPEEEIARFAGEEGFPVVSCEICGSQEGSQRQHVKRMLGDLERQHPGVKASLLGSLRNVRTTHLFDRRLDPTKPPDPEG